MTRTELTELVVLAQKGDKSAIEQIYLYTRNSVINKAYHETNNMDDAEDILQTCYLTVIEKIGDLKEPESFEKWFNTLVNNKIKDFKKKKSPVLLDGSESNILNSEPETNDAYIPHKALERKDNADTVRELVNELDDKKRQSIEMHYFEDKSIAEIANELDISENTVKSRLHSGRNEINKKSKRSTKKILLTILIIVLLAIITVFTISGSEEFFSKIFYKFYDTHIEYAVDNYYLDDAPDMLEEIYTLSYIPEGFELYEVYPTEQEEVINIYTERYHKRDADFSFKQYPLSDRGTSDNENVETTTEVINGYKVTCSKNISALIYIWDNGRYIFDLHFNYDISHEEAVKIIEGVTKKASNF